MLDFPTGGIGAVLSHLGSLIFRPYIDPSEKLENKEQRIKLNLNNNTVKEFNVKIWTLYFKNKPRKVISRDARSFSIGLNIIKDKEVINDNDSEYILIWRSNNFRLPSEINYPEDLDSTKGSDYLMKFWRKLTDYIDSTSTVDLPITTGKNILIFVSIEGLNGIYIPHQIAFSNSGKVLYGIQYDAEFYRTTFSLLPFGKWIFHMVYHINKRAASKGKKFELNIQDWNNIKIKKV